MTEWSLELNHPGLNRIYANYLYRLEGMLRYYLACVAFADHTVFVAEETASPVRASMNFPEVATSIRTLGDIDAMRQSGEFSQLATSQSIIAVLTAFGDTMEDLRMLLGVTPQQVKVPVPVVLPGGAVCHVKPGALKIAHHISRAHSLVEPLTGAYAMLHINGLISLRHMFMHHQGRFSDAYRDQVVARWQRLRHGDRILFNENDFDDALHFLTSNLRGFVRALDKALVT